MYGGAVTKAVDGRNISFSYDGPDGRNVLHDVCLSVRKGSFVVVLGANGSGKSTLMKHLDALLRLQKGCLVVSGLDAGDERSVYQLRRRVGMVFQNPDNQFVSSVVWEDVAFGLGNAGKDEVDAKVAEALSVVGLSGFEKRDVDTLSGGQKQRVALAGVMVTDPEILVFDEAASMLDHDGRRDVIAYVEKLHAGSRTVFLVTHDVEDAVGADLVVLMKEGTVLRTGTPAEILSDVQLLKEAGFLPPLSVRVRCDLLERGIDIGDAPLDLQGLAEVICGLR